MRKIAFQLFIFVRALIVPVAYGAAGAIFNAHGKVLLVRHRYMVGWQLPGGGVGRGEAAATAVVRELSEEVGLRGGIIEFFGVYTRRSGWATNVIALFRITCATIDFQPSLEISAITWADPAQPPSDCTVATRQRLSEIIGTSEPDLYW
jgi:8-oxo-dGTP pyrophosphatase MutT (NUDIX family)